MFIAYMTKEATRISTLESIVDDIENSDGKKKIVTSEMSQVEVAYTAYEKTTRQLDAAYEQMLDDFWADDSVVELVEFHEQIAKDARMLIRESIRMGIKIVKPLDAIHLATAKWIDASEFHTYNLHHFQPLQNLVKCKICEPYIAQPRLIAPE
ncbi:MAG: hypothetical protein B6D41_03405 [Chloroflexi bacterium UTCFX4]|nr:MAG: hypothetical protein B6D41_03405 [Chloroflexi bacterium UTCFX4]